MVLKYNEKVIDHFRNPRNAGQMEGADASATEGSLACGDMMTMYIKLDGDRIADAKFESYGCAANIATGSILTELVIGKTVEEASALTWKDVVEEMGELPTIKHHCASLAVETLQKAIKEAENKQSEDGE